MGLSSIILNWRRPANVARIVEGWRRGSLVNEAVVWNNFTVRFPDHPWARVVNSPRDEGLYSRFLAAERFPLGMPRNEAVLIQDDDLEASTETLRRLLDAWKAEPDVIHGVFGRRPKPDGGYDARNVGGPAEVPIVLTRLLIVHRDYLPRFLAVAKEFEEIQRDSVPHGNGEDILLSYVARAASGKSNRIHRLPVVELPAPHALSTRNWRRHLDHRSKLLRACESWLTETAVAL